jgi:hypothetical protein
MINHLIQPTPVSGYYEYLSQVRHRVNVTPHEETNNEEIMTQTTTATTTTTSPSIAEGIDNHDSGFATNVISSDNLQLPSSNLNDKDVTKWSSVDVQRWIDEQCKKFELKKATTEKFQLNGRI